MTLDTSSFREAVNKLRPFVVTAPCKVEASKKKRKSKKKRLSEESEFHSQRMVVRFTPVDSSILGADSLSLSMNSDNEDQEIDHGTFVSLVATDFCHAYGAEIDKSTMKKHCEKAGFHSCTWMAYFQTLQQCLAINNDQSNSGDQRKSMTVTQSIDGNHATVSISYRIGDGILTESSFKLELLSDFNECRMIQSALCFSILDDALNQPISTVKNEASQSDSNDEQSPSFQVLSLDGKRDSEPVTSTVPISSQVNSNHSLNSDNSSLIAEISALKIRNAELESENELLREKQQNSSISGKLEHFPTSLSSAFSATMVGESRKRKAVPGRSLMNPRRKKYRNAKPFSFE